MARKDEILRSFLSDPLIDEKYPDIKEELIIDEIKVDEAINSDIPIIKIVAQFIDKFHGGNIDNEKTFYNEIVNYLNKIYEN